MSFDVSTLARKKHDETHHSEAEWFKVLDSATTSLTQLQVADSGLERIALASREPSKFSILVRLIYQHGKSYPAHSRESQLIGQLLQYVNGSPYSLADWIDAIDCFYQWLKKHKRQADLLEMLKYLECCVASPEGKTGEQSFMHVVSDMLRVFGYEGK